MKNVLITGASKGIGKVIAEELYKCGYNTFLTARNEEELRKIKSCGYFVADLKKQDDLHALKNFINDKKIDILINNAGEYIYKKAENIEYNEIMGLTKVNFVAALYLMCAVVPNMKNNKWGRIINIGSISGSMGEAGASIYSGTKAGLMGISKSLGLELAEFGITVNTINPGWVDTEFGLKSVEESDFSVSETLDMIPQKRFISPNEIAGFIKYLISEDAKGLTGQSVNLCAGLGI